MKTLLIPIYCSIYSIITGILSILAYKYLYNKVFKYIIIATLIISIPVFIRYSSLELCLDAVEHNPYIVAGGMEIFSYIFALPAYFLTIRTYIFITNR